MPVDKLDVYRAIREIAKEIRPLADEMSDDQFAQKSFTDDLGFDSLDLINLLFRVEERFELKIEEDAVDSEQLTMVGNLCEYVAAHA